MDPPDPAAYMGVSHEHRLSLTDYLLTDHRASIGGAPASNGGAVNPSNGGATTPTSSGGATSQSAASGGKTAGASGGTTGASTTGVPLAGATGADSGLIVVDQFGYLPDAEKIAVVRDPQTGFDAATDFAPGSTYALVDATSGAQVFKGTVTPWSSGAVHSQSGDKAFWFDFTSVTTEGTYYVLDVDPRGQPAMKSYRDFNANWPQNSWSVTESSYGYQIAYIRLLSKFVN